MAVYAGEKEKREQKSKHTLHTLYSVALSFALMRSKNGANREKPEQTYFPIASHKKPRHLTGVLVLQFYVIPPLAQTFR